ncbi:MAG: hypothetical protein EXR71_07160 [Myxococcales bacterium]|nr:hypothetical protein [Myxococcales bacterium]
MIAFLAFIVACSVDGGARALPPLPSLPDPVDAAELALGPERPLKQAIVALTGAVRGEVEVCGCPTTPYGGFARRAALFDRVRAAPVPMFAVDAGEMLVKGMTARDELDRGVRAEAVLGLAEGTGLDAWAASPIDRMPGGVALLARHAALASNWDAEGGLLAARVVERDGVRLGFVGLAGADEAHPAVDVVAAVRKAMTESVDAWFVLSNADLATNRLVAEGVAGLAAVLATEGDRRDAPVITRGAPIIEAPGRGRYVTLIHLSLATDSRPLELVANGIWRDVAATHYGRNLAAIKPEARAAEARIDQRQLVRATAGRAVGYVEDIPLSADLDGPSKVDGQLTRFREAILGAARASAEAVDQRGYATASGCSGCHRDRIASWGFDAHARALESLIIRKKADNPECIACHTTGFGQPGGFAAVEEKAIGAFRDVQCEACHGPMRGHTGRGGATGHAVTEATCRGCHDEANSPDFDYSTYLAKISCSRLASPEDVAPL